MLINQTLEKLHSMRLTGLAEALTQQLEDPDSSVLSFEERIGWLIDRHWIWRENQALARRLKKKACSCSGKTLGSRTSV